MSKILIAYYSRRGENWWNGSVRYITKGNTEVVVEKIKDLLPEADIFHIDTVEPYAEDYYQCIDEAKDELRAKARPEVKNLIGSIDEYDTIILGYPNWWGTMPMVCYTFLESFDFTGKTIIPFCTNEGSGMGSSEKFIKQCAPGAILKPGVAIHGAEAANADRHVKAIVAMAK